MSQLIKLRRGLSANLPASASLGEPLFTTDTEELYVGTGTGIKKIGASDLTTSNFAAGVIDTDLTTVSESDNTLASAKAIKEYVDTNAGGLSTLADSPTSYTATSDGESVIPVGDATFDASTDVLLAFYNGAKLTETTNYTVSGTNITLTFTINTGEVIDFVIIKASGGGIAKLSETATSYTATSNGETVIPVGDSTFDDTTDTLLVFYEGIKLTLTDSYTVSGTNITLTFGIDIGEVIDFVIIKASGAAIDVASYSKKAVAGESIIPGNALYVDKTTGKVKKITFDKDIPGLITLTSGSSINTGSEVFPTSDPNVFLAVYWTNTTTIKARTVDISDLSSPSLGTEYTVKSSAYNWLFACELSGTEFVVLNQSSSSTNIDAYHLAVNTSTGVITVTPNTSVITDSDTAAQYNISPMNSSSFAIIYKRTTDIAVTRCTVSGSTISGGTAAQISATTGAVYTPILIDTNKIIFRYNPLDYLKCGYWNGSSWEFGTELQTGVSINYNDLFRLSSTKFGYLGHTITADQREIKYSILSVDGSHDISFLKKEEYTGIFFVDLSLMSNSYYDEVSRKAYVRIQYNGYYRKTVVLDIDIDGRVQLSNTILHSKSTSFTSTTDYYSMTNDHDQHRVSTIHRNKPCSNIINILNSTAASNYRVGIEILPTFDRFEDDIGFSVDTASADSEVQFVTDGILYNLSGLTAGTDYYLQEDGTVGSTVTQYRIGTAISTTEIAIAKKIIKDM